MCPTDKCAYTKNSACTKKDHINEQAYGMHPREYLTLRLYLARARTSVIESSFGCLAMALVMNQTK